LNDVVLDHDHGARSSHAQTMGGEVELDAERLGERAAARRRAW